MNKLLSLLLITTCFTSTLLASADERDGLGSSARASSSNYEESSDANSTISSNISEMSEEDIAAKYSAAQSKFYSADPAERASGLEVFKEIARDATHQEYQWWALGQLWEYSKYKFEETEEHTFVPSFLKIIATTDEHPNHCQALCMLHGSINADDIAFANPCLKKIATIDEDPDQYEALCTLRSSSNADNKAFAYDQFKRIAALGHHPHEMEILDHLSEAPNPEYKALARDQSKRIAVIDGHAFQIEALRQLCSSLDADDITFASDQLSGRQQQCVERSRLWKNSCCGCL